MVIVLFCDMWILCGRMLFSDVFFRYFRNVVLIFLVLGGFYLLSLMKMLVLFGRGVGVGLVLFLFWLFLFLLGLVVFVLIVIVMGLLILLLLLLLIFEYFIEGFWINN